MSLAIPLRAGLPGGAWLTHGRSGSCCLAGARTLVTNATRMTPVPAQCCTSLNQESWIGYYCFALEVKFGWQFQRAVFPRR